jgi:hypothetical protein
VYLDAMSVILIKFNFKKWDEALSGLIWLVIGTDGGCYEYSRNETLVYIKR